MSEPEVIEGEAQDVPETAVTVRSITQAHLAVGVGALAAMSDEDFDRNLDAMEKGVQRAKRMKAAIMVENEDFGLIPGTQKPTLLKPGAEKLALAYGLTGRFEHHLTFGQTEHEPPITVVVDCFLHLGGHDGPAIAQGMGMASSFEKRYRWRKGLRICPDCGKEGVIYTKGRGGQWWHPNDAKPNGGCGANFPKEDARLKDQEVGDIENPDPFELGNTLLKMAEKRAYVDAVLRATASSGLFSQDMEDSEDHRTVDRETGEILPTAPPPPRPQQTEHLIGQLSRTGTIERGDGIGSDLQAHVTPDGHLIGFRLKTSKGNIAQVWAQGDLAETLFAAASMDVEKLLKEKAVCTGLVYDVRQEGRTTFQRMKLSRIEVLGVIIPPAEVTPLRAVPDEPEPTPLPVEEKAELDALEVPWPDVVRSDEA